MSSYDANNVDDDDDSVEFVKTIVASSTNPVVEDPEQDDQQTNGDMEDVSSATTSDAESGMTSCGAEEDNWSMDPTNPNNRIEQPIQEPNVPESEVIEVDDSDDSDILEVYDQNPNYENPNHKPTNDETSLSDGSSIMDVDENSEKDQGEMEEEENLGEDPTETAREESPDCASEEQDNRTIFSPSPESFASGPEGDTAEGIVAIMTSPYEQNANAELDEPIFRRFKALLAPNCDSDDPIETMNPELEVYFGDALAKSVFLARRAFDTSQECYSPKWAQHKLHWVPPRFALLCLRDCKFADASTKDLVKIIRDLQTTKAVKEVIKLWNLEEDFLNLASCSTQFSYKDNANFRFCCKCEIFVARAYGISHVLRKLDAIDDSLSFKIRVYLKVMDANVKVGRQRVLAKKNFLERKRKRSEQRKASTLDTIHEEGGNDLAVPTEFGPVKEISVARGKNGSVEEVSEASAITTDPAASDGVIRAMNRKRTKRRISVQSYDERVQSLNMLHTLVQEQHSRLGQTMALLQDSVNTHRELTRQEMRTELIAEIKHKKKPSKKGSSKRGTKRRRSSKHALGKQPSAR